MTSNPLTTLAWVRSPGYDLIVWRGGWFYEKIVWETIHFNNINSVEKGVKQASKQTKWNKQTNKQAIDLYTNFIELFNLTLTSRGINLHFFVFDLQNCCVNF